jgi:hypothetical protein
MRSADRLYMEIAKAGYPDKMTIPEWRYKKCKSQLMDDDSPYTIFGPDFFVILDCIVTRTVSI